MSTSRGRPEDIYEQQNDQRLDDLHSKIRTLRGVTTDIHGDVERQNLMLDDTGNSFSSFQSSLSNSSRRVARTFGLESGGVRPARLALTIAIALVGLWFGWKVLSWWWGAPEPAPMPGS